MLTVCRRGIRKIVFLVNFQPFHMTVAFWKCARSDPCVAECHELDRHQCEVSRCFLDVGRFSIFPLAVTPTFYRVSWKDLFRCTYEELRGVSLPLQIGKTKEGKGKEGRVGRGRKIIHSVLTSERLE